MSAGAMYEDPLRMKMLGTQQMMKRMTPMVTQSALTGSKLRSFSFT